jgi:hypothetical protein
VYGFGWLDDELVAVAAEKQVIIEVDDWKESIESGLQLEKVIDDDGVFVDDDHWIVDETSEWCDDILLNKIKCSKFNKQCFSFFFVLLYIVS